jgi:hypothetical protein
MSKKIYWPNRKNIKTRYKEHVQAMRNNRPDTGYCRHILDTGHAYGSIENTMAIIRKAKKGKFLNSLEKCHIFLASKQDICMNEFGTEHSNPIYETIYQQRKEYPHR